MSQYPLKGIYGISICLGFWVISQSCSPVKSIEPTSMPSVLPSSVPKKIDETTTTLRPSVPQSSPSLQLTPEPLMLPIIPKLQNPPIPLKTNSICPIQRITLEGRILFSFFSGSVLSEMMIVAKSLDPLVPYTNASEIKDEFYHLENIPLNTPIEINIFKDNYLIHRKIVKLNGSKDSVLQNFKQDFNVFLASLDSSMDLGIDTGTYIDGKVVDENGSFLENTQIVVKLLSYFISKDGTKTQKPLDLNTNTNNQGKYSVRIGLTQTIQIQIIASKPGFATASHFVDKLFSNRQGDPDINRYNFGLDLKGQPDKLTALADAPLVTDVKLTQADAIYIDPSTAFTLKFSEPMDPSSVEKSFTLQIFKLEQKKDEQNLTCIPQQLDPTKVIAKFKESDFNAIWNKEQTEVSFQYKVPLSFTSRNNMFVGKITFEKEIIDKNGNIRKKYYFRLYSENIRDDYWFIFSKNVEK